MMHDESRRAFSVPGDPEIAGLVRRAQRYDPAAFEQIYERFADTIYLYAAYQHRPAQAAVIVVATFEQAVREIGRFKVPFRNCARRTRNWLLRIAVIQAARYNDATTAEDTGTTGDYSAGRTESNPRVVAALQRLSPEQREIVVLRLIGRLSVEDIVEITGRPAAVVRSAQARGLADMAVELATGTSLRERAA
jgi:RNA polymerase sigma-70 factor, ECF subfamily